MDVLHASAILARLVRRQREKGQGQQRLIKCVAGVVCTSIRLHVFLIVFPCV